MDAVKQRKKPNLRDCLRKKISQGTDRDDAEEICRHVDAHILNMPQLPLQTMEPAAENIASSPGPGWLSRGTNIGTDRVVKPDTLTVANDWARAQKRPLSKNDWVGWQEHARRMGLDPTAMDLGWRTIMDRPEQVQASALATLRTIFGEDQSPGPAGSGRAAWSGYWVPTKALVAPQKRQVSPQPDKEKHPEDMQVRERRKLGERVSVNIKTHQAPEVGNARGQAQAANENPGFGFGTLAASKVFEKAQQLIALYPLSKPAEILGMALRKAGVLTSELTPEDDKLLKMAIDWAQNGPSRTNIRTGGAPGGPFRSTGDSHFGNVRGTFSVT